MSEASALAEAQGADNTANLTGQILLASTDSGPPHKPSHAKESQKEGQKPAGTEEALPVTSHTAGVSFPLTKPLPPEMQLPSQYPAIQTLTIGPSADRYSPIDQAFSTASKVDAEWFRITDKGANAALAKAKTNGADVLVVEDQKNMSSPASVQAMAPLKSAGADVVMSSKGFDISHSKTGVITDKANQRSTWIGSMNLTGANSRDVELNTNDKGIADSVDAVIQADVANAKNGTTTTPGDLDPALVVSPVNAEDKLAGLIYSVDPNKSKGWVIATSENWGDPAIQKALTDVAAAGIPVRVLGPQCDENPNQSLNLPHMQEMAAGGVQAKETPPSAPYEHLKMIEVMTPKGPVGYVGSINFSFQSAHQGDAPIKSPSGEPIKPNRELGILTNDQAALAKIKQVFEQDWTTSVAPAACSAGAAPKEAQD